MAEASRRTGSAGISTAMPQSVPTGECLVLRHFLSLSPSPTHAQPARLSECGKSQNRLLSRLYKSFPNEPVLRELRPSDSETHLVFSGDDEEKQSRSRSIWDWF